MCLILFAYKCAPGSTLVLAANRDEWFSRPSTIAGYWSDHPHVLAGRDLQAGGTWLGISTSGRFAALTNFRKPNDRRPDAPSRGALASAFLTGGKSARAYVSDLAMNAAAYNGFCILLGDASGLYFYSNRGGTPVEVTPGVHGLSNHLLDTPWPKVVKGTLAMKTLLNRPFEIGEYLDLMDDSIPAEEQVLPPGADADWERSLSSMRIMKGDYGTRCSTALRIQEDGRTQIAERTYKRNGEIEGEVSYILNLLPWQSAASSADARCLLPRTSLPQK